MKLNLLTFIGDVDMFGVKQVRIDLGTYLTWQHAQVTWSGGGRSHVAMGKEERNVVV